MALRAVGAALTVVGLLLFAYAFAVGAQKGVIGSKDQWTSDAVAVLVGWFLLMIGPALYFGKTPSSIVQAVEEAREETG